MRHAKMMLVAVAPPIPSVTRRLVRAAREAREEDDEAKRKVLVRYRQNTRCRAGEFCTARDRKRRTETGRRGINVGEGKARGDRWRGRERRRAGEGSGRQGRRRALPPRRASLHRIVAPLPAHSPAVPGHPAMVSRICKACVENCDQKATRHHRSRAAPNGGPSELAQGTAECEGYLWNEQR